MNRHYYLVEQSIYMQWDALDEAWDELKVVAPILKKFISKNAKFIRKANIDMDVYPSGRLTDNFTYVIWYYWTPKTIHKGGYGKELENFHDGVWEIIKAFLRSKGWKLRKSKRNNEYVEKIFDGEYVAVHSTYGLHKGGENEFAALSKLGAENDKKW